MVNDEPVELTVPVNRFLSEVLREDLELTGTKIGCDVGVCGCCTVLVGEELACSCLLPAVRVDGAQVRTIEGVADGENLHPVQETFIECGAVQCGFCTPSMVLTSIALLNGERTSKPRTDSRGLARQLLPMHRLHQDYRGC